MHVTYECTRCQKTQRVEISDVQQSIVCASCRVETPLRPRSTEGRRVSACALCGTTDLYVQKDFPHRLGLSIVIAGIVGSSIAWANYLYPVAIGILMVTAILDLLLYYLVGDVLVCYRCLAQYRDVDRNAGQQAFDLAIGERYRQERIRLDLLRKG
jgi:DNA-directed RNA polymerase subunit RPC12/RpoP